MPFNIILSSNQSYSSSEPLLFLEQWSFDPLPPKHFNYTPGTTLPSDEIEIIIPDFPSAYGDLYTAYFVKAAQKTVVLPPQAYQILDLSGDLPEAAGDGYELTDEASLTTTISYELQNLSVLPSGNYNTNIRLRVFGQTSGGLEELDTVYFPITVSIIGPDFIGLTPNQLNFSHVLEAALPAGQDVALVATGAFNVTVFGLMNLSGSSLTLLTDENGTKTYSGTGSQTITVALDDAVEEESAGAFPYLAVFSNSLGFIAVLNVDLFIFETSALQINPSALSFVAIKNISEALAQMVNILGPGAFTLTKPSWLTTTPSTGQNSTDMSVVPVLSENLAAGTYLGNIVANDGTDDYNIGVIHNVYENVQLGANPNGINFTDDFQTISNFYELPEYKVLLNLNVLFYNYGITLSNETNLNYTLGLFNNRVSFFIGQTLKNIMKELLKLSDMNLDNFVNSLPQDASFYIRNYYLPASVNINILFKHDFDEDLDKVYDFEEVKYIKGRRPSTPFDDTFVLNYYRDDLRVTSNSIALFNFYKETTHQLRIYKNGTLESFKNHSPGTQRLFAYKHSFESYTPGDVVEIRLYKPYSGTIDDTWFNDSANYISQKYIVIPESDISYMIGWENEHGVVDNMEFTGQAAFQLNYDAKLAKNYTEFHEIVRKLDTLKARKCVLNTGFIFKQNTKRIDSLLDAKRAWIISNDNKKSIDLVPLTKQFTDEDTDQDLYAYDVEFEINFRNDFEINS